MGKILALDYGQARVGVALSDEMKILALPYDVLENNTSLLEKIKHIVLKEKVVKIVLGLPLTLSGQEGENVRQVKEFKNKLEQIIAKPIVFQDERMTSKESLAKFKGKLRLEKGDKDKEAARIILESFLRKGELKDLF